MTFTAAIGANKRTNGGCFDIIEQENLLDIHAPEIKTVICRSLVTERTAIFVVIFRITGIVK